jgi:hypothetical protein
VKRDKKAEKAAKVHQRAVEQYICYIFVITLLFLPSGFNFYIPIIMTRILTVFRAKPGYTVL